jgi:hypothetical protein
MKTNPRLLFVLVLTLAASASVRAQTKSINGAEAKSHVGERATVCGTVVSTHYADKTKGSPTFLNLDEPYPRQIFTIVIWGSDRPRFGKPEEKYKDHQVCVTGKITDFRGKPEIAATDPKQIEVQK